MKPDRERVKLAMERTHMTVHDVAKAASLPPQTTAAIICGMNVHPDKLARIARALGVGMADIAEGVVAIPQAKERSGREPPELPAGQVRVKVEKFAELLASSGLSVSQLAEQAGVSQSVIRSILRGAQVHKADTVDKLAGALGVAVCDIIKREDGT